MRPLRLVALALLALLIHTLVPPSSEQVRNGTAAKTPAETHLTSKAAGGAKPVPEEGPWLASRQYFHEEPRTNFETTCIDYLLPAIGEKTVCDATEMRELFGLSPDKVPLGLSLAEFVERIIVPATGSRQDEIASHCKAWLQTGLSALVLPLLLVEWFWFHRRV